MATDGKRRHEPGNVTGQAMIKGDNLMELVLIENERAEPEGSSIPQAKYNLLAEADSLTR